MVCVNCISCNKINAIYNCNRFPLYIAYNFLVHISRPVWFQFRYDELKQAIWWEIFIFQNFEIVIFLLKNADHDYLYLLHHFFGS